MSDTPHLDLAARRLESRNPISNAEWTITITLTVDQGRPVDMGTLNLSDSWCAANPNACGANIAAFIYEKATKRTGSNGKKRAKK